MRGGSDWHGISRLLGDFASTVVIGCQEHGARVLNALLTSNVSSFTRQIILCVKARVCRTAHGRRGCIRWMELPHPFSGADPMQPTPTN
jgi:hypothetical protein